MTDNDQSELKLDRLLFKQVVGTSLGAISVGLVGAGISVYRRKNFDRALKALGGGTLMGGIGFLGFGGQVYDETIGRSS